MLGTALLDTVSSETVPTLGDSIVRYTVPLASLVAVAAVLMLARRHQPLRRRTRYVLAGVAALPLVGSGTLHLLRPAAFLPLLPPWVPDRLALIVATGLPELAGALGLFFTFTRRPASAWLVVFMIAVFPANIYVAGEQVQGLTMPSVAVRTALQAGYILLLLIVGYGWPRYGEQYKACPVPEQ